MDPNAMTPEERAKFESSMVPPTSEPNVEDYKLDPKIDYEPSVVDLKKVHENLNNLQVVKQTQACTIAIAAVAKAIEVLTAELDQTS